MRTLFSVLSLAILLGAGCSGVPLATNATKTEIPSPPTVETSTTTKTPGLVVPHVTPIDFSAVPWRDFSVHRAEPNAFYFKFPVLDVPVMNSVIDFGPTVKAMEPNASLPSVSLSEVDAVSGTSAKVCTSVAGADSATKVSHQTIGGVDYCLVTSDDVGAGNLYEKYVFSGTRGKETIEFQFTVHSTNGCGPYYGTGIPCLVSDATERARDMDLFVSILKTVRLGDGMR